MRDTIASTWVYQLVIVFILLFVAFLILSLTYSKNYKTKNEIINIIEKYEGVNANSVQIINNYLYYNNYNVKGSCPSDTTWLGSTSLESNKLERVQKGTKYYYCFNKKFSSASASSSVKSKVYYQIKTFFKFNLPVVGNIYTFTIDGTTNDIFSGEDLFTQINMN